MKKSLVFLTDFGTADGFAGVMKGVALSINPDLNLVDLTHEVPSFDILGGALILKAHYSYFPKGSVFVCVVDPGVGTDRKPVAVRTENFTFVAPMNGVLDLVLEEERPLEAVEISNRKYTLKAINNTFHGRDIFTPAAAHLTRGVPLSALGRRIKYRKLLKFPKVKRFRGGVEGIIVYFDKFGNAITNIPCGRFRRCLYGNLKGRFVKAFLYGDRDKPNFTCGSFGFVEAFVPTDSFKDRFNARRGDRVRCYF